jgi:hypothetical protein
MTAPTSRRQLVLLGVLLIGLVAAVLYALGPALPWGRVGGRAVATAARAGQAPAPAARPVELRLERLEQVGADPAQTGRNPFRMGAGTPVAGEPGQMAGGTRPAQLPAMPPVAAGPPPPPPVPPIPFKFVGIVSGPGGIGRIAVLSDGKIVVHGRENDIVDGRYRIVKIAEESIQIEHLDGRGRQTIRLTG